MKIKLISLITALLCIVALLASCSDPCTSHRDADFDGKCDTCGDAIEKVTVECPNHVDADGDGVCDTPNCGTVIKTVTKIEEIEVPVDVLVPVPNPKEESIPLVVKPIPADAKVSDYFSFDYESGTIVYNTVVADEADYDDAISSIYANFNRFLLFVEYNEIVDDPATVDVDESLYVTRTYKLYDVMGAKTVITYKTEKFLAAAPTSNNTTFTYNSSNKTFNVTETGDDIETLYSVYTLSYESLFVKEENSITFSGGDIRYATNGEETCAYDLETGKILTRENNDFFIRRPDFDFVSTKFGVVENSDSYEFYDLSKWIELSYVYSVPSYMNINVVPLANGNFVIQKAIRLPDSAVSYDFYTNGEKCDIEFSIFDPATGTETVTDFGYLIIADAVETLGVEITDKAPNAFLVLPIENQRIEFGGNLLASVKCLAVDNELNVLCELKSFLPGQSIPFNYLVVADNRAIVEVEIGDYTVEYVVNEKGEKLFQLPTSYGLYCGAIQIGNKLYSFDSLATPILDLADYDIVEATGDYLILSKTVTTEGETPTTTTTLYYWNANLAAPKALGTDDKVEITDARDGLFVIERTVVTPVEGAEPTISYTYELCNKNGDVIKTSTTGEIVISNTYEDCYCIYIGTDNYFVIAAEPTPAA